MMKWKMNLYKYLRQWNEIAAKVLGNVPDTNFRPIGNFGKTLTTLGSAVLAYGTVNTQTASAAEIQATADGIFADLQGARKEIVTTSVATEYFDNAGEKAGEEEKDSIEWGGKTPAEMTQTYAKDLGIIIDSKRNEYIGKRLEILDPHSYQALLKRVQVCFEIMLDAMKTPFSLFVVEDIYNRQQEKEWKIDDFAFEVEEFYDGLGEYLVLCEKISGGIVNNMEQRQQIKEAKERWDVARAEHVAALTNYYNDVKARGDAIAKTQFLEQLEGSIQMYKRQWREVPQKLLDIQKETKQAGR